MTTAPTAPGKLGEALEPALIQRYLDELDSWLRTRQDELAELDRAALAANRGQELASDMGLTQAMWKAIHDRYQLVFATWDGGRVLQQERERISTLIWGRLDGASDMPGGLAVSLPEACRLNDALTAESSSTTPTAKTAPPSRVGVTSRRPGAMARPAPRGSARLSHASPIISAAAARASGVM